MKTFPCTVLSSEVMQDVVDAIYARHGLPLEGETCRSLLAPILPKLVAQLPSMVLEGGDIIRHLPVGLDRIWQPTAYEVHVPFERMNGGTCPRDKKRNLWLRGAYRRRPAWDTGAEFVDVTCYCSVELKDGELHLDMQCNVGLVEKVQGDFLHSPVPYRYVLKSLGFIQAVHELSLVGKPSPAGVEARRQRVERLNEALTLRQDKRLRALQILSDRRIFSYTQGVELVGEAMMSDLTHVYNDERQANDHFSFSDIPDDEHIVHYLTVYRPDGQGGLREVDIEEINLSFDPTNTHEELVEWSMKFRR